MNSRTFLMLIFAGVDHTEITTPAQTACIHTVRMNMNMQYIYIYITRHLIVDYALTVPTQ